MDGCERAVELWEEPAPQLWSLACPRDHLDDCTRKRGGPLLGIGQIARRGRIRALRRLRE